MTPRELTGTNCRYGELTGMAGSGEDPRLRTADASRRLGRPRRGTRGASRGRAAGGAGWWERRPGGGTTQPRPGYDSAQYGNGL